ncbi:f-box domain-containing, partial [Trichoderma arundinaceum]
MGLALTDLPYTIFTDIISRLSATEAILCRRLSRDAHAALTRNDLCISLILAHFPRSREGRQLRAYLKADDREALERGDWAAVFATLARRYFHLGNALPWKVVKVPVLKDDKRLRGVTPWNRFLSLNGKTAPFHFWDPAWTAAPAEGLLVYPAPLGEEIGYRARDLDTGLEADVPFDMRGKIVRRVRLSHGILVIEWCEQEASHPLNELESAHRHYATAYTVRRTGSWDGIIPRRHDGASASMPAYTWDFEFRCEWKIHYLGLPVNHQDRFFSTHNGTHYAIYTWQPTRSPWGVDAPLERLIIWELGTPSPYRPSEDPSGALKPDDSSGPRIIRSMANGQLREWGIRQGDTPSLRTMALDDSTWDASRACACGHLFFTEEEHRWSAGPHSSLNPPRLHRVKTTGIPLIGEGPRWVEDCGGGGGVNLRFCWRSRWRRQMTETNDNDDDDDDDDEASGNGNGAACSPERAWSHSE